MFPAPSCPAFTSVLAPRGAVPISASSRFSRQTPRRPRSPSRHPTVPSHGPVACAEPLTPSSSPAPSSSSSSSSSSSDHAPHFSLLTDSVLETKWKNEEQSIDSTPLVPQPPSPTAPPHLEDLPSCPDELLVSDPYQAFARFTRIAAPTATLGQQSADLTSSSAASSQRLAQRSYSTASIAYRLLYYAAAQRNLTDFVRLFTGDFDNYHQVAAQRIKGVFPGDGGGHEHIHCKLVYVNHNTLFARYYFNGDPSHVFRTRVYSLTLPQSTDPSPSLSHVVEMRIFRLYEEAEAKLRQSRYDTSVLTWDENDLYDWMRGCEVFWERYEPVEGHVDEAGRLLGICDGLRFVGYMKGGGCELYSHEVGGRIRVMDDLLLTPEDLWVADRGFDQDNQFVYGNRRGIPYKMQRVHEDGDLSWTLSESATPPEGYIS